MGMTVNARELELMVRRLSSHPFGEVRMIAGKLLELAAGAAPSLFLFLEPTAMDTFAHSMSPVDSPDSDEVLLLDCDDDSKVGSLLVQRNCGSSMKTALKKWIDMSGQDREDLFAEALAGLGIHDSLPRIWEFFRAEFQVVLSASAYAQLKRHRMCSRLVSVYDPILGVTVPPSVSRAGLEECFIEGVRKAEKTAGSLSVLYPYMLTNAHRRRVIMSMNGRELYHYSRLREDEHAQWDIRSIAHRMLSVLREKASCTFMLTGGKSEISDTLD